MFFIFLSLPLVCSIIIWFLPLYLTKKNSFLVVSHLYLILIIFWTILFINLCVNQQYHYFELGNWLNCGSLYISWGFQLDSLSVIMLGLVSYVSTAVHFFSINYMSNDSNLIRFFSLLSLFTFFMFILVSSDNFLVLFLGWEGIGICSFLLISFWHTRISATKSAIKAIVLNRIGDSAFLAGCAFVFFVFKSLNFSVVFDLIPFICQINFNFLHYSVSYIEIISILFVIGAIGKSAQLSLHGWLPEAMEGPTPVSALIHAATLVTAGIFLIIRCSPLIEYAPLTLNFILILGGLTCLFGSTVACAQNDIKRIIAFSTTSQLGYMFFSCGLSNYNVALFHLFNHGFFKALLFLCAGAIIFSLSHEQDLRKLGNLIVMLPFIYSAFFVSILALIGFPFLSGFYSKELIIELAFSSYSIDGLFIYWVSSICACLTSFYSVRCLYLTFLIYNNSLKYYIQNVLKIGQSIIFALSILILGSLFSGMWFKDILVGLGSSFFGSSIFIKSNYFFSDFEYISWWIKSLPLIGTFLSILLALTLNNFFFYFFKKNIFYLVHAIEKKNNFFFTMLLKIRVFFNSKMYLDFIINNYFGIFILKHSYATFYKVIDKGLLEIIYINYSSFFLVKTSRYFNQFNLGFTYSIISIIFFSLVIVLNFILLLY